MTGIETPTPIATGVTTERLSNLRRWNIGLAVLHLSQAVTPGEYRRAMQDTVGCLRTAGLTVSNLVEASDGTLEYTASYSPPEMATARPDAAPPDTSKTDAKVSACERRSAGVGAVFVLQHATSLSVRPLPGLSEALARYKG